MKMIIADITEYVEKIRKSFTKYKFDFQTQGCDWCRAFVSFDGVQIGRINFAPCDGGHYIFGWKHYKPDNYIYEDMDEFFYQLPIWLKTGEIVAIRPILEQAKINKKKWITEKQAWRDANPIDRRRKAFDKNYMGEFRKLIRIKSGTEH